MRSCGRRRTVYTGSLCSWRAAIGLDIQAPLGKVQSICLEGPLLVQLLRLVQWQSQTVAQNHWRWDLSGHTPINYGWVPVDMLVFCKSTVCFPSTNMYLFFVIVFAPCWKDQNEFALVGQFQRAIICLQWIKIGKDIELWSSPKVGVNG